MSISHVDKCTKECQIFRTGNQLKGMWKMQCFLAFCQVWERCAIAGTKHQTPTTGRKRAFIWFAASEYQSRQKPTGARVQWNKTARCTEGRKQRRRTRPERRTRPGAKNQNKPQGDTSRLLLATPMPANSPAPLTGTGEKFFLSSFQVLR